MIENVYSSLFQNLAATRSYHNLDVTVKDALQFRESRPEGVTTCTIHESIETVANRLVKAEVRIFLSNRRLMCRVQYDVGHEMTENCHQHASSASVSPKTLSHRL